MKNAVLVLLVCASYLFAIEAKDSIKIRGNLYNTQLGTAGGGYVKAAATTGLFSVDAVPDSAAVAGWCDSANAVKIKGVTLSALPASPWITGQSKLAILRYDGNTSAFSWVRHNRLDSLLSNTSNHAALYYNNLSPSVIYPALGAIEANNSTAKIAIFRCPAKTGVAPFYSVPRWDTAITSAEIAAVVTDETGTDKLVYSDAPTFDSLSSTLGINTDQGFRAATVSNLDSIHCDDGMLIDSNAYANDFRSAYTSYQRDIGQLYSAKRSTLPLWTGYWSDRLPGAVINAIEYSTDSATWTDWSSQITNARNLCGGNALSGYWDVNAATYPYIRFTFYGTGPCYYGLLMLYQEYSAHGPDSLVMTIEESSDGTTYLNKGSAKFTSTPTAPYYCYLHTSLGGQTGGSGMIRIIIHLLDPTFTYRLRSLRLLTDRMAYGFAGGNQYLQNYFGMTVGANSASNTYKFTLQGRHYVGPPVFTGTGLNDARTVGLLDYNGIDASNQTYTVVIDTAGTPDKFAWRKGSGSWTYGTAITGSAQTLSDGVRILFKATTGHTVGDQWVITTTNIDPFSVYLPSSTQAFKIQNNGNVYVTAGNFSASGTITSTGNMYPLGAMVHNPGTASDWNIYNAGSGKNIDIQCNGGTVYFGKYSNDYKILQIRDTDSTVVVQDSLHVNGAEKISSTTASTSTTTGALTVAGGAGVAGTLWADSIVSVDKIRCSSTKYRRYYHMPPQKMNPGAAGATWVNPSANTTGGWNLTNASHVLVMHSDVHSDWDGASDLKFEVRFALYASGSTDDTVDIRALVYYNGVGDNSTKSQTVEVTTNTDGTQYKVYNVTFTIDYDAALNVVDAGDEVSILLNLETDTSENDDILILGANFYYNTTHVGIEDGDT